MPNNLNQVDLAFVVDTTGSMGPFIKAARQHMTDLLRSLTAEAATPIDLRVGVVEYHDHPPLDRTFVARTHAFTESLDGVRQVLADLRAKGGGGDGPEAVYDGLAAACRQRSWRQSSLRLMVLVGDAPPHGTGCARDSFPRGCPCGLTPESVTAELEENGITLYALGLTQSVHASFGKLATFTGGQYYEAARAQGAIDSLKDLLTQEFQSLHLDRQVLELCRRTPDWTVDGVSEALVTGRNRVAASLSRLGRRRLLA